VCVISLPPISSPPAWASALRSFCPWGSALVFPDRKFAGECRSWVRPILGPYFAGSPSWYFTLFFPAFGRQPTLPQSRVSLSRFSQCDMEEDPLYFTTFGFPSRVIYLFFFFLFGFWIIKFLLFPGSRTLFFLLISCRIPPCTSHQTTRVFPFFNPSPVVFSLPIFSLLGFSGFPFGNRPFSSSLDGNGFSLPLLFTVPLSSPFLLLFFFALMKVHLLFGIGLLPVFSPFARCFLALTHFFFVVYCRCPFIPLVIGATPLYSAIPRQVTPCPFSSVDSNLPSCGPTTKCPFFHRGGVLDGPTLNFPSPEWTQASIPC